MNKPFKVARMDMDGEWEVLGSFASHDQADNALDYFCERFPHAYCEVLEMSSAVPA